MKEYTIFEYGGKDPNWLAERLNEASQLGYDIVGTVQVAIVHNGSNGTSYGWGTHDLRAVVIMAREVEEVKSE